MPAPPPQLAALRRRWTSLICRIYEADPLLSPRRRSPTHRPVGATSLSSNNLASRRALAAPSEAVTKWRLFAFPTAPSASTAVPKMRGREVRVAQRHSQILVTEQLPNRVDGGLEEEHLRE